METNPAFSRHLIFDLPFGGSTAYGPPEIKIIVAYFASQAESAGALLRSAVNGSGNTSLAYGFFNVSSCGPTTRSLSVSSGQRS
jgi:hypothetical protein